MSKDDPIETIIASGLELMGIEFIRDGNKQGFDTKGLDFYLPGLDVFIEVKRFHSPRIAEQMARVPNVIVIQGMMAAITFVGLLGSRPVHEKSPAGL